jgi:hypothetical protein
MHGLALEDSEIVELLERITNHYPASTIVCAIPAQLPVQWQTIQSLI